MLIPFSTRIAAHVLQYGYVADAETGEPMRHLGRGTLRITAQFPHACTAHALPGRLAAHVSGLRMALEPSDTEQRAFTILPDYREDEQGRLVPAHVTFQRVVLDLHLETAERPGDSARSYALVMDGAPYAAAAPAIVAEAERFLDAGPVSADLPESARLEISRMVLAPTARPIRRFGDLSRTARGVLAALMRGETIRLGPDDCRDEADFLSVLADVLEVLPPELRPHVSAAAGLSLPDRAFQIAWGRTLSSRAGADRGEALPEMDPAMTLGEAGLRLFAEASAVASTGFLVPAPCRYAGAVITTRDEPGVMPQIRAHLARCASGAAVAPAERASLEAGEPDRVLRALEALSRDRLPPASSGALVASLIRASRSELDALAAAARRIDHPVLATAMDVLCQDQRAPVDLPGLDLVLRLARYAEEMPAGAAYAGQLASRVQVRLAAFLSARLLLPEESLRTIVESEHLSAAVAAVLAREDGLLTSRMLDSIAVVDLLGPEGRTLASRARQVLTPRDERACQPWRTRPAGINDLRRALSIFTSSEPLQPRNFRRDVSELAKRLIAAGRRDVLVDAVRTSAMQLEAVEKASSHQDVAVEQRRLDVIVAVSDVLLGSPAAVAHA